MYCIVRAFRWTASASLRDRRIGGRGHCVRIHEVLHGVVVVVVGVWVGDERRVHYGEVVGRPGTRTVRTALNGDGSLPLPRLGVRKG